MKRKKGFLLLEVIVSIVIITGSLLFVSASFTATKRLIVRSGELSLFRLALEKKMFDLEEKGKIEQGSLQGTLPDDLAWTAEATPLEETALQKVTLEVFPASRPEAGYSVETYLKEGQEKARE